MDLSWLIKQTSVCPNCKKEQELHEQQNSSRILGVILKIVYAGSAVLTYLMIHKPVVFVPTLVIAFVAAWADYKRKKEYKCSRCGTEFSISRRTLESQDA